VRGAFRIPLLVIATVAVIAVIYAVVRYAPWWGRDALIAAGWLLVLRDGRRWWLRHRAAA
jgi:hypothetical protein